MKRILYIILLLPFFSSCGDFLDEVDQDKLVPEKTDHYAALLLYEFNYNYPIFRTVDYMTDNVVENASALTSKKFDYKTTYTWQREIEIDEDGNALSRINNAWEKMYEDVAIANYVIELVDEAIGSKEENDFVKGEAFFIRAFSYFNLLNLYGQPYDALTANVDLGVPIRDNIGVEMNYSRNTVAECYEFIEKDILKARDLILNSGIEKSVWHPTVIACDLLMSRVMLYQKKWDDAINYASQVIDETQLGYMYTHRPFISEDNKEILYSYHNTNPVFPANKSEYRPSLELVNLFSEKDKRREVYFTKIDDGTGNIAYGVNKYALNTYTTLGYNNFRTSEVYLNRAEAYAQKGETENAINDIKQLHAVRYNNVDEITYPAVAEEVLAFVLEERRKELCFEDHHRWFDLRRMSDRPEIKHVFTLVSNEGTVLGTETYTLLPDDYNYTLPIPLKERENNPLIRNNERFEKIPEVDDVVIIP
ncbi:MULTISPECIES: RagB/SusD family nutrient uptake outer membrane protein [unclassified Carboxylicivirga]|uniref:RagB/SusD family nutrient uptake outer membrane protein n=1 Tax=Carboxylicivirga TaxID=1628153 RepID=UPI003D33F682